MGKMGEGEQEVQASSYGMKKSRGGKEQHREYSQGHCGHMGTLVVSTEQRSIKSLCRTPETNITLGVNSIQKNCF